MDNALLTPSRPGLLGRLWPRAPHHGGSRWFGLRLAASVALSLAVIGVIGYGLMADQIRREQKRGRERVVQADVASLESVARAGSRSAAMAEIDAIVDAVGRRTGTGEARLIDRRGVVVAGNREHPATIRDPRIDAALRRGVGWRGPEIGPHGTHVFELIAPVKLPWGRYAYEVTYDMRVLSADLSTLRRALMTLGLIALLVGGAVFYLVGGRRLLRDHRRALERATRDGLTDLPNHRAFQADLAHAVAAAERAHEPLSLVVFDLDGFRAVNEHGGHAQGDALLRKAAALLRTGRAGDRPFRVGGDEFAVLLAHTDEQGARVRARRLLEALDEAGITVSMGVVGHRDGQSAEGLRQEVQAALQESRRRGGARLTHFDEIRDTVSITTSDKRDALLRVLRDGALTTAYQPIWDLHTNTLVALEALSRPDPAQGLSSPAEAFDVAEQIGRVHDLDVLCVQRALEAAPGLPEGVLLFINVTPQTLDLDDDGDDWLRDAVARAGLTPDRVAIEVTERFGGRTETVVRTLERLREQGFRLALDDVGTGNAGLEMLRSVDADFVKLDRSIVAAAATDHNARAVLMAMATFASHTGSFVIAEGIEDAETLQQLRRLEADDPRARRLIQGGQGYGLGRPSAELAPALPALLTPAARV